MRRPARAVPVATVTTDMKEAAMTELRRRASGRSITGITAAVAAFGAAAAVGWASAVPIGGASTTAAPSTTNPSAAIQTAQQLNSARANLQLVRRDLLRQLRREDDMPRAHLPN